MPGHSFPGMIPGTSPKNAIITAMETGTALPRGSRAAALYSAGGSTTLKLTRQVSCMRKTWIKC